MKWCLVGIRALLGRPCVEAHSTITYIEWLDHRLIPFLTDVAEDPFSFFT